MKKVFQKSLSNGDVLIGNLVGNVDDLIQRIGVCLQNA